MRIMVRSLLVACLAAAALAFAGGALAAYAPSLAVGDDGKGVTVTYSQPPDDDPVVQLTFYVPTGYTANLTAAPGTNVGSVLARASLADVGGAVIPLAGTITVADPNGTITISGNQVPVTAASQQCTQTPTHAQVLVLALQASGQTLQVPVYVDPVAGPLAAVASTQMVICLPPPDLPPNTPGRATFGAKVVSAGFTLRGVLASPTADSHRWRLRATPYTPTKGTPNLAGTVEVQTLVDYPRALVVGRPTTTLTRTAAVVRVAGTVTSPAGLQPAVGLLSGAKATALRVVRTVRPAAGGAFSGTLSFTRGAKARVVFVAARATAPNASLAATECQATFAAQGIPCTAATRSGFTLTSAAVRVTVPKKPAPVRRK